jgi:hypothetical protein
MEKPLIEETPPPPSKSQPFSTKDKFLLQTKTASSLQAHGKTMTGETHTFKGTQEQDYCDARQAD